MSEPLKTGTAPIPPAPGLMYQFGTYLWRWLLFAIILGAIAHPLAEPTNNTDPDWYWRAQETQLFWISIPFGIVCALLFTFGQNTLNKPFNNRRSRGSSWAIGFAAWMVSKFIIMGAQIALLAQ